MLGSLNKELEKVDKGKTVKGKTGFLEEETNLTPYILLQSIFMENKACCHCSAWKAITGSKQFLMGWKERVVTAVQSQIHTLSKDAML